MNGFIKNGIEFYHQNGFGKFVVRIFKWIPEYAHWLKFILIDMIRGFLQRHSYAYRGWKAYRRLKNQANVDSRIKLRQITSGLKYCQKEHQFYEILNPDEKIHVVLPEVFQERSGIRKTVFDSPPIYLAVLKEVKVYGETSIISKGDIGFSDMYERDRGKNRYDIEGNGIILCSRKGKWIQVAYKQTDIVIEKAIYCIGGGSGNYWHFTFEILSRLAFADQYEEYRSFPVLVDETVLKIEQMKDLFDRVNVYQHSIIPVEKCSRVHVKNLVYISPNLWLPPNFRIGIKAVEEDFLMSHSVVDNIRNRVLASQNNFGEAIYKKIYLSRRKCNVQRLINGKEIEKIFMDYGYHIVFMEELSFDEQVNIMNHADIIVGVAGAAMSNIVYCHEGARVGCITFNFETPYAFSNIADMVNVKYTILRGNVVGKAKVESTNSFVVNTEKCKAFVEFMEK